MKKSRLLLVLIAVICMMLCALCFVGCATSNTSNNPSKQHTQHSYVNYIYNNDATCVTDGTETAKCKYCDKTDTRVKANTATGVHIYNNYLCTMCFAIEPDAPCTNGLEYTAITENDSIIGYSVSKGAADRDVYIKIPSKHEGKSVISLAKDAFDNCKYLKSLEIENGVTIIDESAFTDCENLVNTKIPNSVTNIGGYAFGGCINLTSIIIPNGVTTIEVGTFYECYNLKRVTISRSVNTICDDAFYQCTDLKDIYYMGSVDDWVSVVLEYGWLSGSSSINIYIENKLLTEVALSEDIVEVKGYSFKWCNEIESISIAKGNDKYYSVGNCLIETESKTLVLGCKNSVIPTDGSVTSIGEYAFAAREGLTSITIPSGVINIGEYAFYNCTDLVNIKLPKGLEEIENRAFYNCNFSNIDLPSEVTAIASYAFSGCDNIKKIIIPNGVTSIQRGVFSGCDSLNEIIIPDSVTKIESMAFNWCYSLGKIYIPKSVLIIEDDAFRLDALALYCEAESKPDGWKDSSIEYKPKIWNCNNNDKDENGIAYVFVDGIRYAIRDGEATVSRGNVQGSVSIQESVTYNEKKYNVVKIDDSAFANCDELTNITIPNCITSVGAFAFRYCEELVNVTIPNSVKSIGDRAFEMCRGLESAFIPNSVTSLGYDAFNANNGAIIYCEAKNQPSGWDGQWISNNSVIVWDCKNDDRDENGIAYVFVDGVRYSIKDGQATVSWGQELNNVDVVIRSSVTYKNKSYSVTSIDDLAFWYSSIKSITIPDGVMNIGNAAFFNCSSLASVEMPNSITSIGDTAFYDCRSLVNVNIPDSLTSIGNGAFFGCRSIKSAVIPNSVTSIGEDAFCGCSSITSIDIPNSVTSIGVRAFCGCSSITSIDIPNSVTSIGGGAFSGCNVINIIIPKNVVSVSSAFDECSNIASISVESGNPAYHSVNNCLIETKSKTLVLGCKNSIIPADGSVTSIASGAFSKCRRLTSVVIPDSVTSIASDTFAGCGSLTSIMIPNSVTSIGDSAFSRCSSLTSVVIPDSVTTIWNSAFEFCTSLKSVLIPDSVVKMESYVFYGCSRNLTVYCEVEREPSGWSWMWKILSNYPSLSVHYVLGYKDNA